MVRAEIRGRSLVGRGADPIEVRPGFAELLARIADNGVRTIIVETANRFARDLMVQEVGYAMLRSLGVTLVAADSPSSFLVDGPTSNLIRQISVLCLNSTRRG